MTSALPFSPVAIIAADCILPGAPDLATFFDANEHGRGAISRVPDSWWGEESLYDPDPFAPNKTYTDIAALLDDWKIDPTRFKMPPLLIESMDPVHALAMDLTRRVVEAVEERAPLPRETTAVMIANIGGGAHTALNLHLNIETQKWAYRAMGLMPEASDSIIEYEREVLKRHAAQSDDVSINCGSGTIGGRISNYFGFRGPHLAVDGACASSMVALHSACIGLDQGTYEAALVGSFLKLLPEFHVVNSKARTLSANGSFPFDERADGFVPGEGAIMVALMPLEAARRVDHAVMGVIRSVGYSANGRSTAPWAPSLEGETLAVRRAFDEVEIEPSSIDYVEAHGTSTKRGDEIEFECLSQIYGRQIHEPPLPFGSVKSMIGHLVDGAGLAGVLRGLFVFERRKLPPTIGITQPRADLPFEQRGLTLQHEAQEVESSKRPLRVGVSSFGYGGVNYHLLLEGGEISPPPSPRKRSPSQEPVAIVAMGGALPDAPDLPTFWKNVSEGKVSSHDLHSHVPLLDLFLEPNVEQPRGIYVQRVAAAAEPDSIDFARYRIMPNRAPRLTKELILLLQATSEAIGNLAHGLQSVDLAKAGCIVGQIPDSDARAQGLSSVRFSVWFNGLMEKLGGQVDPRRIAETEKAMWDDGDLELGLLNEDSSVSGEGSMMASCVASGLDFRGKSFTARAACATSLTALLLSVQELRQQTLDFVLCGATSSGIGLANQVALTQIQALSKSGRTRPYDRDADGFILGSGAVVVALKRLSDAEQQDDEILAVIRDIAATSDGSGTSLLAPNVAGRELVLKRIYEGSAVPFDSVQYVEGHGAATPIGDQTEIAALAAMRKTTSPIYLGSVKGNIGHLKAAAGLAGVAKTVLALHHKIIPPAAGSKSQHPSLRLEDHGFDLPQAPLPWKASPGQPRRAGVNAFGLAGSNCHVLLEEYVSDSDGESESRWSSGQLAASWSASSPEQLSALVKTGPESPRSASGRYRAAVIWNRDEAGQPGKRQTRLEGLDDHLSLDLPDLYCNGGNAINGSVCFLFPGQGSQYPGMLRQIAPINPYVEEAVEAAGATLEEEMPDFHTGFWEASTEQWLRDTSHAQVATLLTSHLLVKWLADREIQPDMLIGHSVGELSALSAAGSISFADSILMACRRGKLARKAASGREHAMAAVRGPRDDIANLVDRITDVHVANLNSPDQTVVSGTRAAVAQVIAAADGLGMSVSILPIECAYHSPLLAGAVSPLLEILQGIELRAPEIPTYRSASGLPYPTSANDQLLRTSLAELYTTKVDFASMIRDAYANGARTFVEVGPKRALADLTNEILHDPKVKVIPLLHPKGGEDRHLLRAAARLWTFGLTDVPPDERNQAPSETPDHARKGCLGVVPEVRPVPPPSSERDWRGTGVLVISDSSGLAPLLAERLAATGAKVSALTVLESLPANCREYLGDTLRVADLRVWLGTHSLPEVIYFLPGFDPRHDSGLTSSQGASLTAGSLAALREVAGVYGDELARAKGEIIALTRLDGKGGHVIGPRARPTGGALIGFLRALHRELPEIRTRVLDLSPLATLDEAAGAALAIASERGPQHFERGSLGEEWTQSCFIPGYRSPADLAGPRGSIPWEEDSTVLLTGGARGITARVGLGMAATRPARFLLLGSTPPPIDDNPLATLNVEEIQEEKIRRFREARRREPGLTPVRFERNWTPLVRSLEIARNTAALETMGAEVEYLQVDLTDMRATRSFARELSLRGRPINILVHGAGVEKSKLVTDVDPVEWDYISAVKIGGLDHLLHLVGSETNAILLFGSIAGAFGGHGQTAYCAASEYLSRFAFSLSAMAPQAQVSTVAWPPWDEVGMAASRSSSRSFLEAHGIHFMAAEEGVHWALAALTTPDTVPELVLLPPQTPAEIEETRAVAPTAPAPRDIRASLVDAAVPAEGGGRILRWRFVPKLHAHLLDHRVDGKVRLPAAHLLEQLAEAVAVAAPNRHVASLENVKIQQPLTVPQDRPRDVYIEVDGADDRTHAVRMWTHPELPDGTIVPRRLEIAGAIATTASAAPLGRRIPLDLRDGMSVDPTALAVELAKHGVEYGPSFQGIRRFAVSSEHACVAELAPVKRKETQGDVFLDVPLFDLALQSLSRLLVSKGGGLPIGFDRVDLHVTPTSAPSQAGWAFSTGSVDGANGLGVILTDLQGSTLVEVSGIHLTAPRQGDPKVAALA
jgi:acyl transferase domain-containing protein